MSFSEMHLRVISY